MKSLVALLAVLSLTITTVVEAASFGRSGGFGGRSSFSSSRSYSSPSRSYSVPRTPTPIPTPKGNITYRPVTPASTQAVKPQPKQVVVNKTVVNKTVVVRQNNARVDSQPSFWSTFLPSMAGSGVGSYIGSSLAHPTPPAQASNGVQYPVCPNPVPKGWNTPCIPAQTDAQAQTSSGDGWNQ